MLDDLDFEIDLGPVADLLSGLADAVGDVLHSQAAETVLDVVDGVDDLEMPALSTTSSSAASPSSGPSPGRTAPPSRPG
jgi:hypothetical protein